MLFTYAMALLETLLICAPILLSGCGVRNTACDLLAEQRNPAPPYNDALASHACPQPNLSIVNR